MYVLWKQESHIQHRWNKLTSVRSSARGAGNSPSYAVFTLAINIEIIDRPVQEIEEPKADCIGSILSTLHNVVLVLSHSMHGVMECVW